MDGAAAAKSRQLCPTLCDPTDGSPADSPVPGIHYILHINPFQIFAFNVFPSLWLAYSLFDHDFEER